MNFLKADEPQNPSSSKPWKVLIVDDDDEVHKITKIVLANFTFEHNKIETISAYSGKEAIEVLQEHSDIALILLDVVMETTDAGLLTAKRIREELCNTMVRIILRTGQPGSAPEHEVIRDYDINDYKEKTELTSDKLYSAVMSSLRSYRDLCIIEQNRLGLKSILQASSTIFQLQSFEHFTQGVMTQLLALLSTHFKEVQKNAFSAIKRPHGYDILATSGHFEKMSSDEIISENIMKLFEQAMSTKAHINDSNDYVYYFETENGESSVFYYLEDESLSSDDQSLLDIFFVNVSIAFENITLNQEISNRQKEKISQMSEMISMIAHQWRQPLASISAISSSFRLAMELEQEITQQDLLAGLNKIEERTSLLSKTIDYFRSFHKPENEKTSFDLDKLIQSCIQALETSQTEKNVTVHTSLKLETDTYSFKNEISQVLINILQNAIDAFAETSSNKEINISTYKTDTYTFILIEDNAGGIETKVLPHIFEPYFSTKDEKNGTGLGLYMSKLIIEEHCDGEITAANGEKGAKFCIQLPLK